MTTYIIKWEKGEKVVYEDGRRLSPKEMQARDKKLEAQNKKLNMVCPACGKHATTSSKKNGEPRKKKCPACGTTMERYLDGVLIKKDASQVKRKVERYNHYGMDKDQAHAFYETSIEGSKRRIQGVGGASHYKAMVPDMDYMVKTGQATKMSDEDTRKARKARKEAVVKQVENSKNFDPKRSNGSQSIK
jgi:hypothetical protein